MDLSIRNVWGIYRADFAPFPKGEMGTGFGFPLLFQYRSPPCCRTRKQVAFKVLNTLLPPHPVTALFPIEEHLPVGKDFIHRVEFQNIEYIESRNKYIIIHCTCGIVYTERCKLSDIEELLDSRFLRCHQSYIINMDEVKEINTSFLMFSGDTVPIRRKDFAKIKNEFEEYTTFK